MELSITADGKGVKLVQPDMNAIPKLGIQLLRSNGKPVCEEVGGDSLIGSVRLVLATYVPSRKKRFVDAVVVDGSFGVGDEVVFEPDVSVLKELGLSSTELLLTTQVDGKLLIPFHNHRNYGADVEEPLVV